MVEILTIHDLFNLLLLNYMGFSGVCYVNIGLRRNYLGYS